jgi:hypothetical protein
MSLIYTEGYLNSIEVNTSQQKLEKNIKNLLIVPPKNNSEKIQVTIYQYSPLSPIYDIYVLNNQVFLKGDNIQEDDVYYIKTSKNTVQLYYEKEDK